jgi:hypothetical protein
MQKRRNRWVTEPLSEQHKNNRFSAIIHAHVRDPLLASLPKEALEELLRAIISHRQVDLAADDHLEKNFKGRRVGPVTRLAQLGQNPARPVFRLI